jgi:hypothetical protein
MSWGEESFFFRAYIRRSSQPPRGPTDVAIWTRGPPENHHHLDQRCGTPRELESLAGQVGVTVPAYMRTRCGFEAWIARGREMQDRIVAGRHRKVERALERRSATMPVTDEEYAAVAAQARDAGLTIPQYVRTRLGFAVRYTSLPRTEDRDREEDDAVERLERLGLNVDEYLPEY